MLTRTVAVAFLAAAAGVRGMAAQATPPARRAAPLDSLARAFVVGGGTPGLSVFVLRGTDTVLLRGYGFANLEDSTPATPRTVYRIGSVTKPFTAVAVMQLVAEGRIALDDTLQRFLPEFPTGGRRVTIRHLLTHTSGIRSYTAIDGYDTNLPAPAESVLAVIARQPFDFAPGERYEYNNSGYFLLGLVLERVTAMSYDRVVRERLASPLGLDDTRYCFLQPVIPRRAAGYTVDGGAVVNARYNAMTQPFSAGGLCATVLDLVGFMRALGSGRIIPRTLLDAMTAETRLADGSAVRYGLGLAVGSLAGHRRISHGGGINGFTSALQHFPDDDLTIAVLANANTDLSPLLGPLARAALGLAP